MRSHKKWLIPFYFFINRIVRNKAAEKAKHVHHQQQSQNSGTPPGKIKPQNPHELSFINRFDIFKVFFHNHLKWQRRIHKTATVETVDQIHLMEPKGALAAVIASTAFSASNIRTIPTWTQWREKGLTIMVSAVVRFPLTDEKQRTANGGEKWKRNGRKTHAFPVRVQ